MKKVVVIGGGTGLSILLRGLKQFPIDISAVVTVADDGRSTGRLREEFHIPAVGDIRQVLIALSSVEPLTQDILNYRFKTSSDLDGHSIGNLLLTAATNLTGSIGSGIESLSKMLNLRGKVLPLTEDDVTLVAKMSDNTIIKGEHFITESGKKIKEIFYEKEPLINPTVIQELIEADLIVISMGSLYTSILPNLISKDIQKAIKNSKAKIMYVSNIMTQPGETDDYTVSDHVKVLNKYLKVKKVDTVIVNNGDISNELIKKYATLEQKDPVIFDEVNLNKLGVKIISDDFIVLDSKQIRHNTMKLAFHIFSNLI